MADPYVSRVVDRELDELLASLSATALEGPKAVGKTETARRRAKTVLELDDPAQRAVAEADAAALLGGPTPVLIDEWQRVPATWDAVRRAVDRGRGAGRFLLTGSATPVVAPSHSGAGRIATVRMRPLALSERGLAQPAVSLSQLLSGERAKVAGRCEVELAEYVEEIMRSGFPGLRGLSGRPLRVQLDGYLRRIIDTDFHEQGHTVRRPEVLMRWMTAYAAATATTVSHETIRDAATSGMGEKPARSTTEPYREVLERLWIVDPVPAWLPTRNHLHRLGQPSKHHLADPALAARLLGLDAEALLSGREGGPPIQRDGSLLGRLFEALVTLSVRVYAQAAEARVRHLRQHGGRREIDLIVERPDQRIVAIEVKLGGVVKDEDVANLLWLREKIGEDMLDALVVHTGPQAYRRPDGIAVVPAALLGP
jgi:uncharacterized protein